MINIVDYGAGNLGSIANMLKKLGAGNEITSDPEQIAKSSKLILPGVGRFDHGMTNLQQSGLIEALQHSVIERGVPILGICLGAQLMTKSSEEGTGNGLGWFDAEVIKFSFHSELTHLRIPHMGWNYVHVSKEDELTKGLQEESRFYFVHSYYLRCNNLSDVMLTTVYGIEFISGISRNNMYAVQFHPEKSHKYGLKLLNNFVQI